MKNTEYWLQFLSEEERELFRLEFENDRKEKLETFLDREFDSFRLFLTSSFFFDLVKFTKKEYWLEILNRIS